MTNISHYDNVSMCAIKQQKNNKQNVDICRTTEVSSRKIWVRFKKNEQLENVQNIKRNY